jgi:uncharacterized protein (UPF0548 family)
LFRSWNVVIDGKKVGKLRPGSTSRFEARPGTHQVWCTVDWVQSNQLMVTVGEGQECRLRCRPAVKPWRWFRLSDATVGKSPWMYLELAD